MARRLATEEGIFCGISSGAHARFSKPCTRIFDNAPSGVLWTTLQTWCYLAAYRPTGQEPCLEVPPRC